MRWDVASSQPEKVMLARELVDISARLGWSRKTLQIASSAALGDQEAWRQIFPRGARDGIWFISEVSDASMKAAFETSPAPSMQAVVIERLSQNTHLKSFVRRVMLFDILHPFQAVARMQRTSRVMQTCLPRTSVRPGAVRTSLLNLAYTVVVLVWLFDANGEGKLTRAAIAGLSGAIR